MDFERSLFKPPLILHQFAGPHDHSILSLKACARPKVDEPFSELGHGFLLPRRTGRRFTFFPGCRNKAVHESVIPRLPLSFVRCPCLWILAESCVALVRLSKKPFGLFFRRTSH